MKIEIIQASIDQKPIIANLLELYFYDFTEYWDFDIGDNGFYGYKELPLYWSDDKSHFPYLIYVNDKIAGLVLVQKNSSISDGAVVWDIGEFFIMKKYKRHGIGTIVAHKIWNLFNGPWQVRVLVENKIACSFWLQAINKFTSIPPVKVEAKVEKDHWFIYKFESKKPV